MTDYKTQQREAAAIRADMTAAYKIMQDAKTRYIKTKLKARSKKQAADAAQMFAELDDYGSLEGIQDCYGYGDITLTEYDRLCTLWDEREQFNKASGQYKDRVIEMIDKAMSLIGDDYQEILGDADATARENNRNQQGRFPKETTT